MVENELFTNCSELFCSGVQVEREQHKSICGKALRTVQVVSVQVNPNNISPLLTSTCAVQVTTPPTEGVYRHPSGSGLGSREEGLGG